MHLRHDKILFIDGDHMKKPRILLSGNKNLQYYTDAVEAAGAEATAKYLPDIDTNYDGLILCGGNDIDPKYYNEEMNGSVDIDEVRDQREFALLKAYLEAGKPILGICRGHQIINVFFGGSLCQHLPETSLHRSGTGAEIIHDVSAVENSVLRELYGATFSVNSIHHQAIDKLGNDLRPTAYWNNKYIEAFAHEWLPVFGVQWHPERMCAGRRRADTVDGIRILKAFVDLCKKETSEGA